MGCYIKKYEELRKALNISNCFAIVKKGFSSFFSAPPVLVNEGLLDLLGLEIAHVADVDEFNETYASRESCFSMGIIDHMNIQSLRLASPCIPKTYDLLQEAIEPQTKGGYYIVRDEDVEKFDLCRSRVSTPVTNELGLAFVCKYHFDAKFNAATKWEWENAKIFIDGVPLEDITVTNIPSLIDKASKIEKSWSFPIDFTVHAGNIRKALEDMAEAAKKVSERIAIDTKAYGYCVTDLDSLHFSESHHTLSGSLSVPNYGTVVHINGQNVDKSKTNDKLKGTWVLGVSDLEDVINSVFKNTKLFKRLEDIRFRYTGKLDTGLNRIAMASEIQEIFDEIEHTTGGINLIGGEIKACGGSIKHTTGDANSIAAEWCECESCPPVIVNIGTININSKEELDAEWSESVREKFAKQFRESCEKVFRENGIL